MTISFEETYHGLLRQHLGNQRIILPAVRAVIPDADGRILFEKFQRQRYLEVIIM